MSELEKFDDGLNLEGISLDELLASAKKDLEDGVQTDGFPEEPAEAPQPPEQEAPPAQPEPFQPQLPPEYAELKTDEEIAEELGLSVNTVRNQISKALKMIKEGVVKLYMFFFA